MENKTFKILGTIRSIYWQEFCTILGDGVEQYLSLSYFLFAGAWILWQSSHFFGCFVVHSLEGGICRADWENKPLWKFEPMKDGTLGNQLPPNFKPVFSERTVCTAKEDLLGFNPVWNSVLWKVVYAFRLGWRFFFAYKNQAYIPLSYEIRGQKQTGIFTF